MSEITYSPQQEPSDTLMPFDPVLHELMTGEGSVPQDPVDAAMEDQYTESGGADPETQFPEEMIEGWLTHIKTTDPDRFVAIEATRKWNREVIVLQDAKYANALNGLMGSAPELLEGRLPQDLEDRLQGQSYVLGVRTHGAATMVEDATHEIYEAGGLDLANQSIEQSVRLANSEKASSETIRDIFIKGFYGAEYGKFVVALPIPEGESAEDILRAYSDAENMRGTGFYTESDTGTIVNSRYLAGFIDGDGIFHPNSGFMRDGFTTEDNTDEDWL